MTIYVPYIATSYQIFADGKLIGTLGGMPPNEVPYRLVPAVFNLPRPSEQTHSLSIAIRVWHWKHWAPVVRGGLQSGIRVGAAHLVQDWGVAKDHETAWGGVAWMLVLMIEALAGLSALAFFALRPREKEYLWFGIMMVLFVSSDSFQGYVNFHLISASNLELFSTLIGTLVGLAKIIFFYRLLQANRDWTFWLAVSSTAASILFLLPELFEFTSIGLWFAQNTILSIPPALWIMALLVRRAFEGNPDARLLVIPGMFAEVVRLIALSVSTASTVGWYRGSTDWLVNTWQTPVPFSVLNVSDALFLVAMLAVLIYRFTRTRQQEERFANELESARTVQQVLIPNEIPTVPGFAIASVYRPASQVGGDFFQIIPTADGGLLVAIGDVSGKGMPAAMTVSLLVGTVRTLAHYTQSPGEILAAMNQRILARSAGGFTTCLVLFVAPTGTLIVANAGHISPYIEGKELPLENGLPLGLAADSMYAETTIQLRRNEQLTLITDGVVEARDSRGELFGFERTAAIATNSAESIVQAAQDFGQEDDITALTLTRVGAEAESTNDVIVLSPSLA